MRVFLSPCSSFPSLVVSRAIHSKNGVINGRYHLCHFHPHHLCPTTIPRRKRFMARRVRIHSLPRLVRTRPIRRFQLARSKSRGSEIVTGWRGRQRGVVCSDFSWAIVRVLFSTQQSRRVCAKDRVGGRSEVQVYNAYPPCGSLCVP